MYIQLKPCTCLFCMEPAHQETNPMPEEPKKDHTLKGVVGIQNMGNTCYSNSIVQLLRASHEWNAFCLTHPIQERLSHISDELPSKRILLAYQDILKSLWSAYKPAYVRPLAFISEVRKAVQGGVYEMFGVPVANDSHEFLVYLMDNFHEALKTQEPYEEKQIPDELSSRDKRIWMAENGWNKFISKENSEIVRLFFGMMQKDICCNNCQNHSYRWEVFNSLKISCDGETFHEWIQNEVKETTIEGYKCDKCNGRHNATIFSHIWKLPHSLFVTLRRFHSNGSKNMAICPYRGETISFSNFFAEESNDPSRYWNYELRGVSDHHGTHMGGHYTAQFKHPLSEKWWWMDDQTAHDLDQPRFSSANYIFFFRKI
uniref:USP domain-containing protein n=1 Tax=viral metagenome TaxID=1070528 RepID=A0A6C0KQD9_9ZZZZ